MDNTSLLAGADRFRRRPRLGPRFHFHKTDKPHGAECRKVNFPAMAADVCGAAGRVSHEIFL